MKPTLIAAALLALIPQLITPPAFAADTGTCDVYAKNAVADNDRATRMGCGFANTNARWQSNYNNHYGWCLNAPSAALVSEAAARDADMRPCESLSTRCEAYAEQATRQFRRSQQLACGFSPTTTPPGRWMDNHRGHYDWCMQAKPEWLTGEAQARSEALNRCLSQ